MKKIIQEPLIQFLLIAGMLFFAFGDDITNTGDNRQIKITDAVLIDYLQTQAKSFGAGNGQKTYDALNPEERESLVTEYIRSEVLYREAMAKGLEQNDEIIRRRLIQKMEFIARGFENDLPPLNETSLRAFYSQHREDYREETVATFSHIFFAKSLRETAENTTITIKALADLNSNASISSNGGHYGDRFLYHRHYASRPQSVIQSHFGQSFSQALFELPLSDKWQGPIVSSHGLHLVRLRQVQKAYIPDFQAIASQIEADARRAQIRLKMRDAINKMTGTYTISREDLKS